LVGEFVVISAKTFIAHWHDAHVDRGAVHLKPVHVLSHLREHTGLPSVVAYRWMDRRTNLFDELSCWRETARQPALFIEWKGIFDLSAYSKLVTRVHRATSLLASGVSMIWEGFPWLK